MRPTLRTLALFLAIILVPLAAGAARRTEEPNSRAAARRTRVAEAPARAAKASGRDALDTATDAWTRLKADRKKRKFREHWVTAIARLERAGDTLSPSQRGAIAYMRAAKAAEELSRLSKRKQDARRAIALYVRVADRCPRSSLVDDALFAAASLEANRLGEQSAAARHLDRAIATKGDRARDARRLLASIDRDREPHAAAAREPAAETVRVPPQPPPSETAPRLAVAGAEPVPVEPLAPTDPSEPVADRAETPRAVLAQARTRKNKALAQREWSLSEQVGLKVRRIIVDAGHGGHDTGAIGPAGVYEKDVTLAIAKKLAETLESRGYEAVLTREGDTFLALEERTSVANRQQGDLFISVHANAHRSRRMGGVETYSLNVASNRYAMRLAARENATSEASVSDLQLLLADFATRANTVDSDRLAGLVQSNIVRSVTKEHGPITDHGTKHALFYVLLGTRMPAVLVETAFLSNPEEEKRLASEAYQATVARAIADGVDQFVARRTQLAMLDP